MVIIILLLSLVLRLVGLNQSLWLDEAVQAITSTGSLSNIFIELRGDFHPPLYHLFMWAWIHLFGNSEIILRLPSVIFGIGTVYLGYKIAKQFNKQQTTESNSADVNNKQQWFALILFVTSPYLIYYSQEARMYSMSVFLATLSSFIFIKILNKFRQQNSQPKAGQPLVENSQITNDKTNFNFKYIKQTWKGLKSINPLTVYYLLFTTLLVYTDYYGWFVVLAQGIVFLWKKRYRQFLISNFLFLILYLPWLNSFITQLNTGIQLTSIIPAWTSLVNLSAIKAIPLTFVKFTLGRITFPDRNFYIILVSFIVSVYSALAVIGIRDWLKNRNKTNVNYINILIYYLFLWLVVPLGTTWLISLKIPNFQPFRLLLILPAFHLITIFLISNIKYPLLRKIVLSFVLTINLSGYFYYQLSPSMKREDWRGLVRFTDTNDASLLIPSESSNWPVRYYTNGGTRLVYGATGAQQVGQPLVVNGDTIYYLRYLVPVFDPEEKIQNQLTALGYNKTDTTNFNQLEMWKYERSNK